MDSRNLLVREPPLRSVKSLKEHEGNIFGFWVRSIPPRSYATASGCSGSRPVVCGVFQRWPVVYAMANDNHTEAAFLLVAIMLFAGLLMEDLESHVEGRIAGNGEAERGSLSELGFNPDPAMISIHNPLTEGQPNPRATVLVLGMQPC